MRNKLRIFGIHLPIFILLSVAAIVLRTIAVCNYIDIYGYFTNPLFTNISSALVAAACIFSGAYFFSIRKQICLIPNYASPMSFLPSAAVAAALPALAIHLFTLSKVYSQNKLYKPTVILAGIFALITIAYFAVNAISTKRISIRRTNLGLCSLIFYCLYVAMLNFDKRLPLNAPNKAVDTVTYLFVAIFFLYEMRLSMGREKWKHYLAYGYIASLLTAYSSIPAIITYFLNGRTISNSIYETILTMALCLFITLRVLMCATLAEDKESDIVRHIREGAIKREGEVAPKIEDAPEEQDDENQLSITYNIINEENDPNPELSEDNPEAPEAVTDEKINDEKETDTITESEPLE